MSNAPATRGGRRTRRAGHSSFCRSTLEQSRALYHCNYCHRDISDNVRIKCADCADFDLCVECFAVGVELHGHNSSHAYRVMDNLSFPILHPAWGSDEELLLLEAVDMYGLGNWAAVAEHVGTKSQTSCESHYFQIYIDPPSFPLPTAAPEMAGLDVRKLAALAKSNCGKKRIRLDTEDAAPKQEAGEQQQPEQQPEQQQLQQGSNRVKQEEDASASAVSGAAQASVPGKGSKKRQRAGAEGAPQAPPQQQQQQGGKTLPGGGLGLPSQAVPGAAGAVGADGAPRVRGSGPQLDVMTGWHPKRQEFEPAWDNDAEAAIAELEFREGEPAEETAAKLRLLEIYNKRLDERERRQAFILDNGLLNVRRMQGLLRRRMAGERERHSQTRVFARYLPPGCFEALVEGLVLEGRLRTRISELQAHRIAGRRTLAEVEEAELVAAANKKKAAAKAAAAAGSIAAAAAAAAAAEDGGGGGGISGTGGYRSTASALAVWRQRRGVQLDITGLPGADQLNTREAELCSSLRLLPAHYLSLKDVMMRDADVHGPITRSDARAFFRLEPLRSVRIWELLCSSGWLAHNAPEDAEDGRRRFGFGGARLAGATPAASSGRAESDAGGSDEDMGAEGGDNGSEEP